MAEFYLLMAVCIVIALGIWHLVRGRTGLLKSLEPLLSRTTCEGERLRGFWRDEPVEISLSGSRIPVFKIAMFRPNPLSMVEARLDRHGRLVVERLGPGGLTRKTIASIAEETLLGQEKPSESTSTLQQYFHPSRVHSARDLLKQHKLTAIHVETDSLSASTTDGNSDLFSSQRARQAVPKVLEGLRRFHQDI